MLADEAGRGFTELCFGRGPTLVVKCNVCVVCVERDRRRGTQGSCKAMRERISCAKPRGASLLFQLTNGWERN
jgi:hypothetical protein